MSRELPDDARAAYHRLEHEARILGTVSHSIRLLAASIAAAYLAALCEPAPDAWALLVTGAASLVERANAVGGILVYAPPEREALDFFTAFVNEMPICWRRARRQRLAPLFSERPWTERPWSWHRCNLLHYARATPARQEPGSKSR